ncbi:MAG: SDR family oxidoreductase [Alphaproteobacteria bacterium]|nr:SDR family oxidoreductase [Alphaproteobacteria bacterium]
MSGGENGAARYGTGAALIGGGSGGIGAAIAETLARAGSDVVLTYYRNADAAERAAGRVQAAGRRAHIAQLDLADAAAAVALAADTASRFGALHTVVYAAGPYIDMRHIACIEPDLFQRTVGTDLFGCYHLLHAALPHLRATKGTAVALGTPAVRRYARKDVLSSAPKAAVEQIVKGIAAEEGRYGVRANCVGVGVITDGMYHALKASGDFDERFFEATRQAVALGRLGSAQDVADAVAFLLSDRAGYITGQTLMVDGGYAI